MKFNDHKRKFFLSFAFLMAHFMAFSQKPQPEKFHDTKGNTEVTKSGQLQYTLNIDLPPGIKNSSPNISLIYNSGGQNGLAGYNWNIAGLSSISRSGRNLEKDGITKGVQLDYSDYYSFNGQRLILKSGEYGKNGAEYMTEKYSNMRIRSLGSISGVAWQGPEYWEVTSPDGSQAWYGAMASGSSSGRSPVDYNIVKTKDTNGNYVSYNYTLEGNVSVISSIQWGGNETVGTGHMNRIDFSFVQRPKDEAAFIKGVELAQSKILQSITVSTNNKQYRKYNLSYKEDAQLTTYRYLEKITVLNSNNEEANPVVFTMDRGIDKDLGGWDNFNPDRSIALQYNKDTDVVGDFDGDGNLDLLRYHSSTSSRIPQTGLYLYKNFYSITYVTENPVFISSPLQNLKDFTATNFKKSSVIGNRQGIVGYRKLSASAASPKDLQLSFYSFSDNNTLVLDFTKTIPDIENYDPLSVGGGSLNTMTILGLDNFDFNGDGLNELVLSLNYRMCFTGGLEPSEPVLNAAKLPPGTSCENYKKYIVIDPDESIQNDNWHYTLDLFTGSNESDAFKSYKQGDFNGDGIVDFLRLSQSIQPLIITFHKNSEGKYESSLSPFSSDTINGDWSNTLVGDFNGDGISDLMMPKTGDFWYLYTSKGNSFKEETVKFIAPRPTRTVNQDYNNNIFVYNPRSFVVYDLNNDGKAEALALDSRRIYSKSSTQDNYQAARYDRNCSLYINVFSSTGGHHTVSSNTTTAFGGGYEGGVVYLNDSNIASELAVNSNDMIALSVNQWTGAMLRKTAMVSAVGVSHDFGSAQRLVSYKYYDIARVGRIRSITQGGITTEITYKELDQVKNPGFYKGVKTENYPYVEINQAVGLYVVSGLSQSITFDKKLKQDFRYRGLTSNILGRGMIGFRQSASSSWYADGLENTKIWSGVEIDPLNEAVPIKEWSIRTTNESKIFPADISENNIELLSFKSSSYKITKLLDGQVITSPVADNDKARIVTAILPQTTKTKDFLTGTLAENTVSYGAHYLPLQSISRISGSYAVTTANYSYDHNPSGSGADYFIGRVKATDKTVQAYNDSQSDKEEYTYENNRIKTIKRWNRDNSGYTLDTFGYDTFGNAIQKVVTNSIDSGSDTTASQYDPTGRFIIKKTDNAGLQTQITYNDLGQVLTQVDPMGNTSVNTYDLWGKLLSSETNLEGLTTYSYDRDSDAGTITYVNHPDGNISTQYTNKLGQNYKTSTKAFGSGQFISQETQFDILGRKIKESEPYFEGQSASQWNTISYDDSVFPTKVTATSFNGKQTETSISGFTKTVKEVNGYGRATTQTTDALGNTISTTDKGGTIQFSYNAAGDQLQAKYAENTVTTKYDAWGRKSEFNDPSNGVYTYEYDGLGRAKKTTSPKGKKEYVYNSIGQLVSQTELSTTDGGQATNKSISFSYDNKGLITGKSGIANSQPFSTAYTYDTKGRIVSTVENSNGRLYSEKGIVYDAYGRMASYDKELQSSGTTTKVSIENSYSTWNGGLAKIMDRNSGKVLWELNETNAKGMVLKAKLGAATINNAYDSNDFLTNVHHASAVQADILKVKYTFDAIRNELTYRKTEGDFAIEEKFYYDDNNRLVNWTNPVTGVTPSSNRNVYDVKGRILENDQVGTMKYENASKIYRPTGMDLNASGTQNYDGDLIQSIQYNENNDPVAINGQKSRLGFYYGLTSMRQQVDFSVISTSGPIFGKVPPMPSAWRVIKSKFYDEEGSFEVVRDQDTNQEKHILYIAGNPYESNIIFVKDFAENTGSYKFLHKDYIGSILAITDEAGNKLEQRHYDAWGNFTHLKIGSNPVITDKASIAAASLLIDRGYTSHEHFMGVGIIHMNGRLYDPLLRRFLNADENIQDPMNTQNYNKYGYVMNNPLMYNDPNGEFWWWAAGAIIGGYLSGVQANNGQWNPGKWAWERTWSAVLGGAIGGAAISGALGNIAANAGAIKTVLPGIISGGLNSAFTGSNFLSGMVGGISYSSNIFTNKLTSTNDLNAGYKYIISPNYNDEHANDFYQEGPVAPWYFDKKGEELLNHWLKGSGKNLNFAYDRGWSEYMRKNGFIHDELLKRSIARSYTMYRDGKTNYSEISGNFSFEIDNTYNTGYGMLHGTRYFSYVMKGKYNKLTDSYIFNYNLKWTDQINYNKNVLMDRVFNGITRAAAHPADYWITIKWTQTIIVKSKEWERLR
ncbi:RHS repeat-associated core domain-containing protein [uncultured Chryseobacterium sp.]|uniref:RHS repeat-associated core domain-containing protein n=1 Tax=uncultured Chryseobacterium sp. TaxID=259322 RepID=UPI0025EF6A58|nr:RHS repeat-associated core domain-containing protein [uncultured Chryseobacterium sp.]